VSLTKTQPFIIGIAGGSGAGKTTLCRRICSESDIGNSILPYDSYYKDLSLLPFDERCKHNFDHPNAFDNELFYEHLLLLKQGTPIDVPIYDYSTHTRSMEFTTFYPSEIILVEGIMLFHDSRIRKCCDHKIYLDLEPDIRFIRRLKRDVKERGRTVDSVVDQYLASVRPMHNKHVEPSKSYADIVINCIFTDSAVRQIIDYINSIFEVQSCIPKSQ
jgi:uridine kinase